VRRVLLVAADLYAMRTLEAADLALRAAVRPPNVAERPLEVIADVITPSIQWGDSDRESAMKHERQCFERQCVAKANLAGELLCSRSSLQQTASELQKTMLNINFRRCPLMGLTASRIPKQVPTNRTPLVIFDEREFRAELPYQLYAQRVDVVPLTLTHGDYIISPDCAIERKSLPDFISSLFSGRLENQLEALRRQYTVAVCLIEFDSNSPFRITGSGLLANNPTRSKQILNKVGRLIGRFPQVRFVWSRSPRHTAMMIGGWKRSFAGQNPDPGASELTCASSSRNEKEETLYAMRVLSKFPGVRSKNILPLMTACGSLAGLGSMSKEAICQAIGDTDGGILFAFLHNSLMESV
jgi:ERCC4-type nuclease